MERMFSIPAKTPEGRYAKVIVLLKCLMGDDWGETDAHANYEIRIARDLLIELRWRAGRAA
jgi:hypothetical protein